MIFRREDRIIFDITLIADVLKLGLYEDLSKSDYSETEFSTKSSEDSLENDEVANVLILTTRVEAFPLISFHAWDEVDSSAKEEKTVSPTPCLTTINKEIAQIVTR